MCTKPPIKPSSEFLRGSIEISAVLLALVLASCRDSRPDIQAEVDKEAARIVAETNTLAERLKAEKEQAQKDYEDAKLKWAEDTRNEAAAREAKDAEEEHKRRMRKLDQDIAAQESKAKRLNEQQEREEKRRQEKLAKAKVQEETQKAQAEKMATEQAERRRTAEKVFRSISLTPHVTLSPILVDGGTQAEVKGEALEILKDLYQRGDWLGVYNYADKSSVTVLPEPVFIGYAARDLGQIQISLFLKTSYLRQDEQELMVFALRKHSPGRFFSSVMIADNTNKHPDGTGYIFPWKFEQQHVFVVLGDRKTSSEFSAMERAHKDEVKQLETRLRLTEISKTEFDAAIDRLDSELPKRIARWVLKGSNN